MTAPTKLENLLNPQVVAEYIDAKLVDKIKLSPLAVVGTTLQGRPGNTLTVPVWEYIGTAQDLAEGVADVPVVLNSDSETVQVKKAAKSVSIMTLKQFKLKRLLNQYQSLMRLSYQDTEIQYQKSLINYYYLSLIKSKKIAIQL